jgi:hypothetical protein
MAVAAMTHALCEAVSPQSLTETPAAILAALVAMKQYVLRPATLLVRHVRCLDYQVGVGLG